MFVHVHRHVLVCSSACYFYAVKSDDLCNNNIYLCRYSLSLPDGLSPSPFQVSVSVSLGCLCLSVCLSLFLSLSARCAQAEGTLTSSELRRLSPATTWHRQCHWDGPSQKLPWRSPGADSENNLDVWLARQLYKVYTVRQREQRKPNWNPKKKKKKKRTWKKKEKKKEKKIMAVIGDESVKFSPGYCNWRKKCCHYCSGCTNSHAPWTPTHPPPTHPHTHTHMTHTHTHTYSQFKNIYSLFVCLLFICGIHVSFKLK